MASYSDLDDYRSRIERELARERAALAEHRGFYEAQRKAKAIYRREQRSRLSPAGWALLISASVAAGVTFAVTSWLSHSLALSAAAATVAWCLVAVVLAALMQASEYDQKNGE